jgi:peptidoglycan hydrolase-like protein with peptidoglycan-binding domain
LFRQISIAWVAVGLAAATPSNPPPKTPPKKKAATAAPRSTVARKNTAPHKTRRTLTARAAKPAPRSTWHSAQAAPTPERYKEIQQALAQKGYLHGEPTGVWNQDSMDALRRFQHDQNLESTGKLDSLSLIALGLGPKH